MDHAKLLIIVLNLISKDLPSTKIVAKKDCWYHRVIGWFLSKTTPDYMERYWTTFSGTIAHPGDELEAHDWGILLHEQLHLRQERKWTLLLFQALYLLGTPVYAGAAVLLALLLLPLWILVAPWWISLIIVGVGCVLSSPVPFGRFRAHWELQAYELDVAVSYWMRGSIDDSFITYCESVFTSANYFFMLPHKEETQSKFKKVRKRVIFGGIFSSGPYAKFYRRLYRELKAAGATKSVYNTI